MIEIGRRTATLPPPPSAVWEALDNPRRQHQYQQWLDLLDDETDPGILESARPSLVVWSSIWPSTPDIVIRFDIAPHGSSTALTFTMTSPTELDPSALGHRRYRMNYLLWSRLRDSFG